MTGDTRTGDIMERMILPALERGGYDCKRQVFIGRRPSGSKHYVDALAIKDGQSILVSSKWQQVSGTAEQKVPFEVICLIVAMKSGKHSKAYLVLGGEGWTLREFYIGDGLLPFINGGHLVKIVALENFVGLANKGEL